MKADMETQDWGFSIRPARLPDAADLHGNCFPEQSAEDVRDYLCWCLTQAEKGRLARLVAEVDECVVGSGQLTIFRRVGEIGSLVVAPAYRRRGIGTALLGALIDVAKHLVDEIEIGADVGAPWLRAWYERQGFTFAETRAQLYSKQVAVSVFSIT